MKRSLVLRLVLFPLLLCIQSPMRAQDTNWVESTLASMSIEEKVGQLFIADCIATYAHRESESFRLARKWVIKYHVGGFVIAGGTVTDIAVTANALQKISRIPLVFNADLEGGLWFLHPYRWVRGRAPELPRYVRGGGTIFPSAMGIGATGDTTFAYEFGRITARESRAIGIHWTNTPVADVNINPKNPIINTRSFGEDPEQVGGFVAAYVRGLQEGRMIATLKHFPGHGDTEEDTHMKLPVLPFDRNRLERVELIPFRNGIAAGAKAVMTAHIALPAIDPHKRPSTLSRQVITGILRKELNFKGIVITDGMTMQGITDHYSPAEAAVLAIEAGADVILVPADLDAAYNGVLKAVEAGRISPLRLDESVRRILTQKSWVGLHKNRFVEIEHISREVASPASEAIAEAAFNASVTLLRNKGRIIPFSPTKRVHVITITDSPNPSIGDGLMAVLQKEVAAVTLSRFSNETGSETIARATKRMSIADVLVVGVYLSVGSWKGELGFSREIEMFLRNLSRRKQPVVLIAFGDPYVLARVPTTDVQIAAYSGDRTAEEAVARALIGAIEITGKLPVTIPGKYKRGDGLQLSHSQRKGR